MLKKSKYLVANERDMRWGLIVETVGYEEIAPNENYPTTGHADGYYFNVDKGRILNEYQMLYTIEGQGYFMSDHLNQLVTLKEGDIHLLFPGEWHSYYPDKDTGWKSYWIGFKGQNMDVRLKENFLSPERPIYHVGYSEELVQLYRSAYNAAIEEAAYSQQLLAGIVNHMIGLMYSLERNIILNKNQSHVDMIKRAQLRIREDVEKSLTIQQLAEEFGISYSTFRKLFKEYTGISPALYQQDLKLQRAKELLTSTDLSVKEIAYRLNFETPDYFSSRFKIKTGRRPSELR
ncbi:DNA-binding domain-containing protein, AraC-type [Xylanibacter oryzae DSM 17970]|uniref:DNA-binding domain-containing protein, AraC-type n=1 Tax=Xylanibacter oryzae DSM 17970 TaxID=915438 RepID=A0ABP3BC93_9BACT|nr:AraC family transcriptional regulator [Xylanibacter oryzae]EXG77715.1 DNA-binding domain-containing protein, AraC-type [Xylanibacter oryzae DSM 17970]HRN16749.1 AraC family transcriptional regulator [Xylanibacter oryzae]